MTTTDTLTLSRAVAMLANLAWIAAHPDLAAEAYSVRVTPWDITVQAEAGPGAAILALAAAADLPIPGHESSTPGHPYERYTFEVDGIELRVVIEAGR